MEWSAGGWNLSNWVHVRVFGARNWGLWKFRGKSGIFISMLEETYVKVGLTEDSTILSRRYVIIWIFGV